MAKTINLQVTNLLTKEVRNITQSRELIDLLHSSYNTKKKYFVTCDLCKTELTPTIAVGLIRHYFNGRVDILIPSEEYVYMYDRILTAIMCSVKSVLVQKYDFTYTKYFKYNGEYKTRVYDPRDAECEEEVSYTQVTPTGIVFSILNCPSDFASYNKIHNVLKKLGIAEYCVNFAGLHPKRCVTIKSLFEEQNGPKNPLYAVHMLIDKYSEEITIYKEYLDLLRALHRMFLDNPLLLVDYLPSRIHYTVLSDYLPILFKDKQVRLQIVYDAYMKGIVTGMDELSNKFVDTDLTSYLSDTESE